ncbi:hypothetical protein FF125_09525 [Aureibaculum algae]|uniref:Uncharacterized protein n=1 Tax=Aureibaculum algae TaxID=2584122 RepID=A0A5B7TQU8_9FLAO|nr:hypothetical protein [Aureibaculum algae]QCX38660.1 hypothetical protein FF125_09525 [Aureibaculum algae]
MKEFTENLEYYIEQYELEKQIFQMGKEIKNRGWLEKSEFLTICLWKSRRPKRLYDLNSNDEIMSNSKLSFAEKDELKKIKILTKLKGVQIPTASAILSVFNPGIYPIIDERCIQSLKYLKIINWKTINAKNWIGYLKIIRDWSKKNNKTAREIEKGLYAYNRINLDKEYTNLYK